MDTIYSYFPAVNRRFIQAYAAIVLCFTGESRTDNDIINEHVIRRILETNIRYKLMK